VQLAERALVGIAVEAKVRFAETVGAAVGLTVAETETAVGFSVGPVIGLGKAAAVAAVAVGAIVGRVREALLLLIRPKRTQGDYLINIFIIFNGKCEGRFSLQKNAETIKQIQIMINSRILCMNPITIVGRYNINLVQQVHIHILVQLRAMLISYFYNRSRC